MLELYNVNNNIVNNNGGNNNNNDNNNAVMDGQRDTGRCVLHVAEPAAIRQLVTSIKTGKSSSIQHVRAQVLKDCFQHVPISVEKIINSTIELGAVPMDWKVGTIVPLPKAGSASDVSNWRPICLLNMCNKMTEKVIHKELMDYLVRENLLTPKQSGFIPGKCTGDAIYGLMMEIYNARNKGHRSAVVFLNLRKAFDTVDHLLLLQKLAAYGLADNFLKWLKDYLTGRQQQTRANNILSDRAPVDRGVPQGSVVGPLLFVAYINDVSDVIVHSKYYLYADDLALVVSAKNPERIRLLLQEDLDKVGQWCARNKLTVNTTKTQVLWSYSARSVPDLTEADLFLNGNRLEVVSQFNYLGVTLDTHMTLTPHMKKRIGLVRARLAQLRKIREKSDVKTSVEVYTHMVKSIMEYCSFVVEGGPVWASRKFQTLQNDGLRICERVRDPRGVDIAALHQRNRVSMLSVGRTRQLLGYLHTASQMAENVVTPVRDLRGNANVKLKTQRIKKMVYEKSPLIRGLTIWNELSPATQRKPDRKSFLESLKD